MNDEEFFRMSDDCPCYAYNLTSLFWKGVWLGGEGGGLRPSFCFVSRVKDALIGMLLIPISELPRYDE